VLERRIRSSTFYPWNPPVERRAIGRLYLCEGDCYGISENLTSRVRANCNVEAMSMQLCGISVLETITRIRTTDWDSGCDKFAFNGPLVVANSVQLFCYRLRRATRSMRYKLAHRTRGCFINAIIERANRRITVTESQSPLIVSNTRACNEIFIIIISDYSR